jgi:hypothetical protein
MLMGIKLLIIEDATCELRHELTICGIEGELLRIELCP